MTLPVLFKPFLRIVEGEEKAWGDTIWITTRLNELRAKAGHSPAEHKNVLRSVRGVIAKLQPEISALNFEPVEKGYLDTKGEWRPFVRFSQDVLLNVCASIGGPVEHQLLHEANVELNQLRKLRATDSGTRYDDMVCMLERVLNRSVDQSQMAVATSQVALATANEAKQDCADLRRLVITGRSGNIVAIGLRCEDVTETKKLRVKAYSATRTHASKCGIPTKLFARQHEWNTHNMMHDIKHASLNGCRYCRKSFEDVSKELGKPLLQVMSIDIRYPKQPPNYRANTDWICGPCNSQKRDMTPEEFIAYLNAKKAEQARRQEQEAQQLKLFT